MDAQAYVADTSARWRTAIGTPRDETDPTMPRLNRAVNDLAHLGQWQSVRPLLAVASDFLLTLSSALRNAALAPGPAGPGTATELGERLREANDAAVGAHNRLVDLLQALDHGTA